MCALYVGDQALFLKVLGGAMGFEVGRVDHQPKRLTTLARQLGEDLVGYAKTALAHKPIVDGLVRTLVTLNIAPT